MARGITLLLGNLGIGLGLLLLAETALQLAVPRLRPRYERFERTAPGQYPDRAFTPENWPRRDPQLGWVCNRLAILDAQARNGRTATVYRINPQGFRSGQDFDAPPPPAPDRPRLLLLGESFLFGRYVTEEQTIAAHLQQRLGPRAEIFNLAIPGWGLDQMVLAYRRYAPRLQPTAVVLFYIDEDVERVYQAYRKREGMGKPSFDLCAGRLVPRVPAPAGWGTRLVNRSYLLSAVHHLLARRTSARIARAFLDELQRTTAAHHQQLLLVRCPLLADLQHGRLAPRYDLAAGLPQPPVRYRDLTATIAALAPAAREALYLPGDMHLAPAGCRLAAEVIAEALLPPAPAPQVRP